jgi:MFS family permease
MAKPAAPSQASLLALSSLNFFPSDMQTAFGPIAAAYLTLQGWTAKDIGSVLTIGSTASFVSQIPGGELVDTVRPKRLLVATGVVTVALSVVILRLWSSFPLVAFAEALQGITSGVLGPAVVALPSGWSATPGSQKGLDRTSAGGVAAILTFCQRRRSCPIRWLNYGNLPREGPLDAASRTP